MIRIKSAIDAPDFRSPSRNVNGSIFEICIRWRNAEGGLKDKQMGEFILIMGLKHNFQVNSEKLTPKREDMQ
jgi:hypothetical protein